MSDYIKVAAEQDVAEGQAKVFDTEEQRVLLCKVAGKCYAIADVCTHDGGPLGEGDLDGFEIICPRHGARFDVRTGAVLAFPAIMPVASYAVMVADGEILVKLDE